jgi:hypothetical protein
MDITKKKLSLEDRREIAKQIYKLGDSISTIRDQQNECRKLGLNIITLAGAFMNPFHMDELYQIIAQFSRRKLNEELAKRN